MVIKYFSNSIENMRDLGGYKSNSGKTVKEGKLIRSNLPVSLKNEEIEIIKKINISNIIDLRSKEEYKIKPSIFENNNFFKVYHIEINIGKNIPVNQRMVSISYIEILKSYEKIKEIFDILNKSDGAIFFCNAGKDRTGVISAIILKLLGVEENKIIDDYILTDKYMHKKLEEYANGSEEILNIITPKKEYMEEVFRWFNKEYKSIENYMKSIGITDEMINNIRNKYLK